MSSTHAVLVTLFLCLAGCSDVQEILQEEWQAQVDGVEANREYNAAYREYNQAQWDLTTIRADADPAEIEEAERKLQLADERLQTELDQMGQRGEEAGALTARDSEHFENWLQGE